MACQLAGAFQRAGGLAIWDQITDAVGVRHSSVVCVPNPWDTCVLMARKSPFPAFRAQMAFAWEHGSPVLRTWYCQYPSKMTTSASPQPSSSGFRLRIDSDHWRIGAICQKAI